MLRNPSSHSRRSRLFACRYALESCERRVLLAAHIAGGATVYDTIQAAVDAASPGDTINVDAGVYSELVTINKQLTLRGAQAGIDARKAGRGAGESVLQGIDYGSGNRSTSFYISANDVTVDGFTAQGDSGYVQYGAGIVIAPSMAGTHIVNNIIQNNTAGIYLANGSATDQAVIQHNLFSLNNLPGPDSGRGIYVNGGISGGLLTNVLIDGNTFLGNQGGPATTGYEAAIGLETMAPNSQGNITITNNVMDSNGKALLAYNVDNVFIANNTITRSTDAWSGTLRFEGAATHVTIQNNTVWNNTGAAVRIDNKAVDGENSGFVITGNNFYKNGIGLWVEGGLYTGGLDAGNNWWGNASGPKGDGAGTGDSLYANGNAVTYSPWRTSVNPAARSPFYGVPFAAGDTIQAEDYNNGGEGVGYHDAEAANLAAGYRTMEGVDIEPCTDAGGGYNVGYTKAGEWLEFTINVPSSGYYGVTTRVASPVAGGSFHIEFDGVNATGSMAIPNTGGWQMWDNVSSRAVSLSAGTHIMRLVFDGVASNGFAGNVNWLNVSAFHYQPGIRISGQTPTAWNTTSTIAGSMNVQMWNGDDPTATCKAVVGIRDAAGNWVGGTPQVIDTEIPTSGAPGTTKTICSFAGLAVPTTPGTYSVWVYQAQTTSDADAIAAFENSRPAAQTETDRLVGTLLVPGAEAPFLGTPFAAGDTIQAENYNGGGEGVAYHDAEPANLGGAYRPAEGVDIETTRDTGGGYSVGWTKPGEWMDYSVNIATAGTYTIGARVGSAYAGGKFHYELDGVNLTGAGSKLTAPSTGGWQNWTTMTSPVVNLPAGAHVLRVVFDTANASGFVANFNWFKINTYVAPVQTPFKGTPFKIGDTIQAEDFDTGGEGLAYHDTEAANLGGQYRPSEGVDIEATTDTGGGYDVSYTHAGEWMAYTLNAATAGTFTFSARIASPVAGAKFHVEIDGVNVTGSLAVPSTGGWQTWKTITKSGIAVSAGQHVMRVVFDANATNGFAGNWNWMKLA